MVKTLNRNFLQERQADFHETWYVQPMIVYSNVNPLVTLTYFMARSNLVILAVLWEKVRTVDFSETIATCDLKVGRCRQLIEIMKVC